MLSTIKMIHGEVLQGRSLTNTQRHQITKRLIEKKSINVRSGLIYVLNSFGRGAREFTQSRIELSVVPEQDTLISHCLFYPRCLTIYWHNAVGIRAMDQHPIQGGREIILVASDYRKRDKLGPDELLGSYADLKGHLTPHFDYFY